MSEHIEHGEAENKVYELGFLLSPALPEEKLADALLTLKAPIEKAGGAFISEEAPKLRPLSYTMIKSLQSRNQRFDSAYFGWLKFEVKPSSIKTIEDATKANPEVIRFLLITTVKENTLASLPRVNYTNGKTSGDVSAKTIDTKTEVSESELDKTLEKLVA